MQHVKRGSPGTSPGTVRRNEITLEYRKNLLKYELGKHNRALEELNSGLIDARATFDSLNLNGNVRQAIREQLVEILENFTHNIRNKAISKLNKLYRGVIKWKDEPAYFINLSTVQLTQEQKEILNFGPKFHYQPKFSKIKKKLEIEQLYESILKLKDNDIITIKEDLKPQLLAESTKIRYTGNSLVINKALRKAAQNLKNHPDIIVRKADKSSAYVVLDKCDYKEKLDAIISDPSKFKKITKNPINALKIKLNRIIKSVNGSNPLKIFSSLSGDFKPGYLYGTVKTHKPGNPLRPIISQVQTPTYSIAKQLNSIISKYLPAKYQINSTDEFLDIIRTINPSGHLASLDVQSLLSTKLSKLL